MADAQGALELAENIELYTLDPLGSALEPTPEPASPTSPLKEMIDELDGAALFFDGGGAQMRGDLRVARGQRLPVIKPLGGDLARVVDTHQSRGVAPRRGGQGICGLFMGRVGTGCCRARCAIERAGQRLQEQVGGGG